MSSDLQVLCEGLVKATLEICSSAIAPDDGRPDMQQHALIVEQRTCSTKKRLPEKQQ